MCCCNPFLISHKAPITSGIVSVFILIVSISRSLYFESFLVVFIEMFLSDGTVISMTLQLLLLWSVITISGLGAAISLPGCICISQSIEASSVLLSELLVGLILVNICFLSSLWVFALVFFFLPVLRLLILGSVFCFLFYSLCMCSGLFIFPSF